MKSYLFFILSFFILCACKKGEDDPFLSLRSRNKRITGTWELKSMTYRFNEYGSSFDGTTMTETTDGSTVDSYQYSQQMILSKDNTAEFTTISDGTTTIRKETWNWFDSDKKKSGLFFPQSTAYFYRITRLTNKELVIIEEIADPDMGGSNFQKMYLEKKFTKK